MRSATVAFRVDASTKIGTGHVMRCLSLASALRRQGSDCQFICQAHEGHQIARIEESGFQVHVLHSASALDAAASAESGAPHAHWLGGRWEDDALQVLEIVEELAPGWLVVDHYGLDAHWETVIQELPIRLMAIDDLADRPHNVDALLDQNLGRQAEDYAGLVPPDCNLLIGPRYALIRSEFAHLRRESLKRRQQPRLDRLLISMGGIDKDNATGRVLEALRQCSLPDGLDVEVLMGGNAPWLSDVQQRSQSLPCPTRVHVDTPDVARHMVNADLAIGAAGSTAWERCCLGLPAIIAVLAENQRSIAAALEREAAALMAADIDNWPEFRAKWDLAADTRWLAETSRRAARVTDGLGASAVASILASASA